MQHGKKYRQAQEKLEAGRLYEPSAAIDLVKKCSTANFDATVEVHLTLGVDPRHADQMVRGSVSLPHGTGRKQRIAVFAIGEKAKEANDAGADIVGGEDLAKKVEAGEIDFDVAISTPDLMGTVGKLGKVLGPRGLMPNPKAGTVTFEVGKAVKDVRGGRTEFRVDRYGIVHGAVGKVSFGDVQLEDNLAALMEAVVRAKPSATKGTYLKTVTLAPTMGPGVRLDPVLASRMSTS